MHMSQVGAVAPQIILPEHSKAVLAVASRHWAEVSYTLVTSSAALFTDEAKEQQDLLLEHLGIADESTRIGLKLANFCLKAESFYAEASGLRPQSLGLYSGRAIGLKF